MGCLQFAPTIRPVFLPALYGAHLNLFLFQTLSFINPFTPFKVLATSVTELFTSIGTLTTSLVTRPHSSGVHVPTAIPSVILPTHSFPTSLSVTFPHSTGVHAPSTVPPAGLPAHPLTSTGFMISAGLPTHSLPTAQFMTSASLPTAHNSLPVIRTATPAGLPTQLPHSL